MESEDISSFVSIICPSNSYHKPFTENEMTIDRYPLLFANPHVEMLQLINWMTMQAHTGQEVWIKKNAKLFLYLISMHD